MRRESSSALLQQSSALLVQPVAPTWHPSCIQSLTCPRSALVYAPGRASHWEVGSASSQLSSIAARHRPYLETWFACFASKFQRPTRPIQKYEQHAFMSTMSCAHISPLQPFLSLSLSLSLSLCFSLFLSYALYALTCLTLSCLHSCPDEVHVGTAESYTRLRVPLSLKFNYLAEPQVRIPFVNPTVKVSPTPRHRHELR